MSETSCRLRHNLCGARVWAELERRSLVERIDCGLDVHRGQITFDYLDLESGEVTTGQVVPATRERFREWLSRFEGRRVRLAFEGCTGWRFIAEEVARAGFEAHMAEPADTATLRGRKKRPKTDRKDARLLRVLLTQERLPESWIPPGHVSEVRILGRTYERLLSERRGWKQRVHAQLFQQGVPADPGWFTAEGRDRLLGGNHLSAAGRRQAHIAFGMIDVLDTEMDYLRDDLAVWGRLQPGCAVLRHHLWGVGVLLAPIIWSEMGDTRRFGRSDQAVRHTGLDVTVFETDGHRAPGKLSRQGPSTLRWALVEAAQHSSKRASPHHRLYQQVRERHDGSRAALTVARKLARQTFHLLNELGDQAWEPIPVVPFPTRKAAAI